MIEAMTIILGALYGAFCIIDGTFCNGELHDRLIRLMDGRSA